VVIVLVALGETGDFEGTIDEEVTRRFFGGIVCDFSSFRIGDM